MSAFDFDTFLTLAETLFNQQNRIVKKSSKET
jgi:hypothetical protein